MITPKQAMRQFHREKNGKYARVNPCNSCGQSAGVDYYSDRRTDTGRFNDIALVLCQRCCEHGESLPDNEALAWYENGVEWGGEGPEWAKKGEKDDAP